MSFIGVKKDGGNDIGYGQKETQPHERDDNSSCKSPKLGFALIHFPACSPQNNSPCNCADYRNIRECLQRIR